MRGALALCLVARLLLADFALAARAGDGAAAELRVGSLRVGKVLFLGNSITLHGPAPKIGWNGNWGMAASVPEKDYVHVLVDRIAKSAGGKPTVLVKNIADFERGLTDFNLKEGLKEALAFEADLIVIAIGENVAALATDAAKAKYSAAFSGLLAELKQHGRPTILVRSQFWANPAKDEIMKKVCAGAGGIFVDNSKLGGDETHYARAERKIEHGGVAGHPGDKGMRAIADALWSAILKQAEPAPTELGKLAASMKPGTWAELNSTGYTAELLKAQNHHILQYTSGATWEPKSRQMLFIGQGHYSALKFIGYSEEANTWELRPTPTWWKGDPATGKGPIGHAYFNNTIDAAGGVLFHHQSGTRFVHRYEVAKAEWTTLPEIKDAATGHGTAIAYFPERKGLVRVLGGQVHFYNIESNAWTRLNQERLPMGPYHNFAQYSPAHKAVIFGGGNGSKDLHKLDSAGKFTALKSAPVEVGINTTAITMDASGSELLVLHKSGQMFAFNPAADAWREIKTDGMPFAMKESSFDVVATPVSNHDVTLFFTAQAKGLKVCLYKHTATK